MGWGGRWEGELGRGTHVNPWLIHVNVWQKPLQYCKVISLQLIEIIGKKLKTNKNVQFSPTDSLLSKATLPYIVKSQAVSLFILIAITRD